MAPSGRVSEATVDPPDALSGSVRRCVTSEARAWRFRYPASHEPTRVSTEVTLQDDPLATLE